MRWTAFSLMPLFVAACGTQQPSFNTDDEDVLQNEASGLAAVSINCEPSVIYAHPSDQLTVRAVVRGSTNKGIVWSVRSGRIETDVDNFATYTAPARTGRFTITARAAADTSVRGVCVVRVISPPNIDAGNGAGASLSVHTALGIPDQNQAQDSARHVVVKDQYVLSYNSDRKVPNWVSWELNSLYFGGATRSDGWRTDKDLPPGTEQASDRDYTNSGWDRGHMCAAADRSRSVSDNKSTFVLSNAMPQAHNVNTGPWQALERYLQDEALYGKEIFVISGGIFGPHDLVIGDNVHVPSATWKVAVIEDMLSARAPDITTNTRVIAVLFENDDEAVPQSADWKDYLVTVDDLEHLTGFDLLADVDVDVQESLEAFVDHRD